MLNEILYLNTGTLIEYNRVNDNKNQLRISYISPGNISMFSATCPCSSDIFLVFTTLLFVLTFHLRTDNCRLPMKLVSSAEEIFDYL